LLTAIAAINGTLLGEPPAGRSGRLSALASKASVIKQHLSAQWAPGIAVGHGAHELLVQRPGSPVTHAHLALERQRRQPRLGLADQVHRQEPDTQREFGAVHNGPRRQRRLASTLGALKKQSIVMLEAAMFPLAATRTHEPFRPAPTLERRGTLLLASVPVLKFHQRHATLKLDSVHRHDHSTHQDAIRLRLRWLTT
jgi:hypothetical protein